MDDVEELFGMIDAAITKYKAITVLRRPTWLDKAGMSKGIDHDRQHLDIIMAAGECIMARQINPDFKDELTLRLLNDDSGTELETIIGGSWIGIKAVAASVPFIDTPYVEIPGWEYTGKEDSGPLPTAVPVLEYQCSKHTLALPVYCKGDDEIGFFDFWDFEDAAFGLVESEYAVLLVPSANKNDLKNIEEWDTIDGLIGYYNSVFNRYNSLAGLSFTPERMSDLNCRNRYFLKTDKQLDPGVYYSSHYAAESSSSDGHFWLKPVDTNWTGLRGIGQGYGGYGGKFMADRCFSVKGLWSYIYAACYHDEMLSDDREDDWLPCVLPHQSEIEKTVVENIAAGVNLDVWDARAKLYFLVMVIMRAGLKALTCLNQQYRFRVISSGNEPWTFSLMDMLSESCANDGVQLDVTPFVLLAGGHISPAQQDRNLFSGAKAVYPLNYLVEKEMLPKLEDELDLPSALCLVDVEELRISGLKGQVTLYLQIDDFAQIYGETVTLMDGVRTACRVNIDSQELVLPEMPIGPYTLWLPTGRNRKYQTQSKYLIVKPGATKHRVRFVHQAASRLASQTIILVGPEDNFISKVTVDLVSSVVTVVANSNMAHSEFANMTYAEVTIKDGKGVSKFSKKILWDRATISVDQVTFQPGYKLEIYHREPRRVLLEPASDGLTNPEMTLNMFEITCSGLTNVCERHDANRELFKRVKNAAAALRQNHRMLHADCSAKVDIFLAIQRFRNAQRKSMLASYADCIPLENEEPSEDLGNRFTVVIHNESNWSYLTADFDMVRKRLTVKHMRAFPYSFCTNMYASFRYLDADGQKMLKLKINGSELEKANKWSLPISGHGGEEVYIRHSNTARVTIRNVMQNLDITPVDPGQSFCIPISSMADLAQSEECVRPRPRVSLRIHVSAMKRW